MDINRRRSPACTARGQRVNYNIQTASTAQLPRTIYRTRFLYITRTERGDDVHERRIYTTAASRTNHRQTSGFKTSDTYTVHGDAEVYRCRLLNMYFLGRLIKTLWRGRVRADDHARAHAMTAGLPMLQGRIYTNVSSQQQCRRHALRTLCARVYDVPISNGNPDHCHTLGRPQHVKFINYYGRASVPSDKIVNCLVRIHNVIRWRGGGERMRIIMYLYKYSMYTYSRRIEKKTRT